MTDMQDVISWIVVLVFIIILFRKRLAPFFKGRKKPDKPVAVEKTSGDGTALRDKEADNVYFKVIVFDVTQYMNDSVLSDVINNKLHMELDLIYRNYVGEFISLDAKVSGNLLLFLISWHT